MRILVVDDSRAMRMIVRRTLRQAGFGSHDVAEAADGSAALEAILASPPDLVLCDWNMPRMDGMQLLLELVRRRVRIPFGFVTSEGTPDMRRRALDSGAAFLIAKPFTPLTFEMELEPFLG